jgi:hypothetical protein
MISRMSKHDMQVLNKERLRPAFLSGRFFHSYAQIEH